MRRPDLTGTYTWHFVSDINKIEGIEEGVPYLVCFEEPDAEKASWHMVIARWFLEDTEISLTDKEGNAAANTVFRIRQTEHEFLFGCGGFDFVPLTNVEDEKVPNMAVTDSALSGWNWRARALHKKAKDQPPTTL